MEKRGIRTERGDLNREIEVTNKRLRQLKARISKLQNWLKEETENTEPPTLADYIQGILSRKAQAGKLGYSQSLYNLKDAAKMLNFLQANNIMDMTGLDEKFKSMIGEQLDIQGKLKPVERRLGTLPVFVRSIGNNTNRLSILPTEILILLEQHNLMGKELGQFPHKVLAVLLRFFHPQISQDPWRQVAAIGEVQIHTPSNSLLWKFYPTIALHIGVQLEKKRTAPPTTMEDVNVVIVGRFGIGGFTSKGASIFA